MTYEARIDLIRKIVALLVIVFGVGLAISLNHKHDTAVGWCGLGFLLCIATTMVLALEYLVRLWIQRRKQRPTRNQFTIAGLLVFTLYAAIACALYRLLGFVPFVVGMIFGVILAAVVIAPILELLYRVDTKR